MVGWLVGLPEGCLAWEEENIGQEEGVDGWWMAKGHSVLNGSAVCHPEHYFFIACVLPQKKYCPLVDCCMES